MLTSFDVLVTCSNQKRRASKLGADLSNFQPVNSDLKPFRGIFCGCLYKMDRRLS